MAKVVPIATPIYEVEETKHYTAAPIKYTINENGCHICVSHAYDRDGYPRIQRGKDKIRGNRCLYTMNHGEIPPGMVVMHTCDNPHCINPEHLILGTHKENMADRQQKGRTKVGSENGKAKLNDEQVYYIRFISKESTAVLAEQYHVDQTTIRKIRKGKTYPNVTIESCPNLNRTAV